VILVPELLGWRYRELPAPARKGFEVVVHVGTAAGLALALRRELAAAVRSLDAATLRGAALSLAPPALAGAALGATIEERLSGPRSVAAVQIAAGTALAAADRRGGRRRRLRPLDHAAVLTAARLRGLSRPAAGRLARESAGPVVAAAAARELWRLARGGLPAGLGGSFVAGAVAALLSARASARLAFALDRLPAWWGFGAYRVALGLVALAARPAGPPADPVAPPGRSA
jgi:undecaprenyl pyrophosphate phosphatase UppP